MPSRAPYLDDVLKPKNFLWANDLRLSTSPQCWLRIPMQTTADKIKIPSEPASHMASISSIVSSFDEYLIMCGATTEVFHSLWRFAASRKISLNCFYTPRNFFHSARHFFFVFIYKSPRCGIASWVKIAIDGTFSQQNKILLTLTKKIFASLMRFIIHWRN